MGTFTIDLSGLGQAVSNGLSSLAPLFYITAGLVIAGAALAWGIDMLKSWNGDGSGEEVAGDLNADWEAYVAEESEMEARYSSGEIDTDTWNDFVHERAGRFLDRMESLGLSDEEAYEFLKSRGSRMARWYEPEED